MSGFSREWLALREPADARARERAAQHVLLPALCHHLHGRRLQGRRILVLDLGCGTGANLRWLAPRLPAPQHWRLVDHDAALLADAAHGAHGSRADAAPALAFEQQDLAQGLPDLHDVDLVTTAALLDLVSRAWLAGLVAACAARRTALLLALSYDGRIGFLPRHRDDARVRDAVNRHQLRDKGFAAALGPGAAAAAGTSLQRAGYRVTQVRSDWWLTRADTALHDALIGGWADVVREQAGSGGCAWIEHWHAWRLAHRATLRVGHVDLLALPPPA